jgi:para-aminobenzoate synthetase component 1
LDLTTVILPYSLEFWQKALHFVRTFPFACCLDGNEYSIPENSFPKVIAAGKKRIVNPDLLFGKENQRTNISDLPCFGLFYYPDKIDQSSLKFPESIFFISEFILEAKGNEIHLQAENPQSIISAIEQFNIVKEADLPDLKFNGSITYEKYISIVEQIKELIREGTLYELNFCQFFEAKGTMNGLELFLNLQKKMPMPFSSWFKAEHFEIACASPERFLKKNGNRLVSQPIKGTIKRGKNPSEDLLNKGQLSNSEKDKAENLMIVDLVRNDLARISEIGSTKVDELFGIYPMPTVFQMISTVSSVLSKEKSIRDVIMSAFPMGSMTGAPKLEVMNWIDKLETRERGAFSGAMGFIDPEQNFDFNVLIRSVFIDHYKKEVYFAVGSAITIDSIGEDEWQECKAKAAGILQVLKHNWEDLFN